MIRDFSENHFADVWRLFKREPRRCTWCQNQPDIHCRLDVFFPVSESSLCEVTYVDIVPSFKTDHSMITLNVALHSNPRGTGFWKLNTSHVQEIKCPGNKNAIESTVNHYKDSISVSPALFFRDD